MTLLESLNWHEPSRMSPKRPFKPQIWDYLGRTKSVATIFNLGSVSGVSLICDPLARRTIAVKRALKLMRFVQLVRKLQELQEQGVPLPLATGHGAKWKYHITPMAEAAHRMNTSLKKLMPTADDKEVVKTLIAEWSMAPEKRAAAARAAQNKLLMETVNSEKVKDRKFALEVIKSISKDVQVGMEISGPAQLGAAIGEGLRSILADVEIPKELAAAGSNTSDANVVIDAEFTEVPSKEEA